MESKISDPTVRFAAIDDLRRRRVISVMGTVWTLLTIGSTALTLPVSPPVTLIANLFAILGFVAATIISRSSRFSGTAAVVVLLATMQIQYVGSVITLTDNYHIGMTIAFSGICPLIASGTLSIRGTLITSLVAIASVVLVIAVRSTPGLQPERVVGDFGAIFFLILIAGAVAVLLAWTAARARGQLIEEAEAAAAAREAASAAEDRFRVVADQLSDLVAVLDEQGRYTFASASHRWILGVSPDHLLGTTGDTRIHPSDIESVQQAFRDALQDKEPHETVVRQRIANGEYASFHTRLVGVVVDGKKHVAVTSRDVTLLQRLSRQLETARRMDSLGRLAGGVAHDFNNLLQVIHSCLELALMSIPKEQLAHRHLTTAQNATGRASELTAQLVSFARGQVLQQDSAVPAEVVGQLRPILESALGKSVSLTVRTEASRWQTSMDATRLQQILMNLATNAQDAMPEGGTFHLVVTDRTARAGEIEGLAGGDYVLVEASDSGVGISDEIKPHIFEPFFTTKAPDKGTGLGLATSFGLVKQIGGLVTVDSVVGEGTTFRVFLPRALPANKGVRAKATDEAVGKPVNGLKVLVVDDQPVICSLVGGMLSDENHSALTATSFSEALDLAHHHRFDIILADLVLGTEDGLELLEQLQSKQPQASAIVMSGYVQSQERLAMLHQRGVELLAKPFSSEMLFKMIARASPSGPSKSVPLDKTS